MSAYGKFTTRKQVKGTLASTIWHCKPRAGVATYVTIHHLTLSRASAFDGLVSYLHTCFAEEVERGMTYPQEILQGETYTQTMFEDYFFAGDVLLAIAGIEEMEMPERKADGSEVQVTLEEAKNGRSWEECVAGLYYVRTSMSFMSLRMPDIFSRRFDRSSQTIRDAPLMYASRRRSSVVES